MTRRRWIADEVSGNRAALTGEHADHLIRILRARVGPPGSAQFRSTDRRVGDAAQIVEQIAERIGEAKGTMSLRVES